MPYVRIYHESCSRPFNARHTHEKYLHIPTIVYHLIGKIIITDKYFKNPTFCGHNYSHEGSHRKINMGDDYVW